MEQFTPFFKTYDGPPNHKEIIIVGSGPAALQMAYQALSDGFKVHLYEKSDKPGGLLTDGIPAYKFHKEKIDKSFALLKQMGLKFHLNSEVLYDARQNKYHLKNNPEAIAYSDNDDQKIVLCVGAGKPKSLPLEITATLDDSTRQRKILQAVDFLKSANDIAAYLEKNPELSDFCKEQFIRNTFIEKLGIDPRHKKIGVIGGGDTAQDVTRWLVRYFKEYSGQLNIFVRGPKPELEHLSKENQLRDEEVRYIQGDVSHLVEPIAITLSHGKLNMTQKISHFKYHDDIQKHKELTELFNRLPREAKPLDDKTTTETIEGFDLIICALGFEDPETIPLVASIPPQDRKNVVFAGDASGSEKIIVSAQANADRTYRKKIKPREGSGLGSPSTLFQKPGNTQYHHVPSQVALALL